MKVLIKKIALRLAYFSAGIAVAVAAFSYQASKTLDRINLETEIYGMNAFNFGCAKGRKQTEKTCKQVTIDSQDDIIGVLRAEPIYRKQ